jgi:protoheme IX farnesyltransferase
LIGWAAASGSITSGKAWILYAVLFLWQFPHFMAIAWMYREDYARASYLIFPTENEDRFLIWMTAVPALALFVAGLGAVAAGGAGVLQYSGTILLGSGLLYYAIRQILIRSKIAARQLLKATILYLPLQFFILLLKKG